jgi:hypothetical protein
VAHADDTVFDGVSGYYEQKQYLRVHALDRYKRDETETGKNLEDVFEARTRIRLKTGLTLSDEISGKLSSDIELYYNLGHGEGRLENAIRLWEAYLDFDYEAFSVRLGRQVIRWGKADQVNVIDNFTPQDLRNFLDYKRGDRKWPVLAASVKYFVDEQTTWENIWMPYFRPNPIAGREQDWEFFFGRNYVKAIGLSQIDEERSKNSLGNGIFASKLAYATDDYDISFSYAYHFEQNPSYSAQLNPDYPLLSALPYPGTVQREYKREETLGMDYETQLGDFGLRGELIYTTDKPYVTYDLSDDDLIARRPTVQLVAGFDYRFESETYINVQMTLDHIRDFDVRMEAERNEYSLTWQVSQPFMHDRLVVELMGRAFFHQTDLFYRVSLNYEFSEDIQLTSGLMIFDGDDLGIFGEFEYNDQLFFNLKYSFKYCSL